MTATSDTGVAPEGGAFDSGTTEVLTASHWGAFYARVRDGRIVSVRPFEADAAPSINLDRVAETATSGARILKPMVRRGWLERGPESRGERGDDDFVEVSWERAVELVARELDRVYAQYGPSAVWGRSYGWKSTGAVNNSIALLQRLLSLLGGWVETGNSYSTAAISTILPYATGGRLFKPTSWPVIEAHAERVVFWGCDPLVTNDIDWATTLHRGTAAVLGLAGHPRIRTIAVNPVRPATAEALGSRWIPVRAGTDTALIFALLHVLVTEDRADADFLERCTDGWERLRDYVLGLADGVEKTPEWAAEITGVAAREIRELARELSDRRTMIMFGWGPQRARYGEQPPWAALALACALGQVGLPGGGIGFSYHYESGGWPSGRGPALGQIPARPKAVRTTTAPWRGSRAVPVARMADVLAHPGKVIDWNGSRIEYPDIRLVFWSGGNPFAHHPDTRGLEAAWRRPETVIVSDAFWTATARHADIVLPATTTLERDDITPVGTSTNDGILLMRRAVPPAGLAKSDFEIFSAIARALGLEAEFTEGLDAAGWIRRLYREAAERGRAMGVPLPDFEEFARRGFVLYETDPAEAEFTAFADFRRDPEGHPLPTETGRIVLYSKRIEALGYGDAPAHPMWMPPFGAEAGEHAADREAERERRRGEGGWLELVSPKSGARLHSQLHAVTRDRSAAAGREACELHPRDAAERGIAEGDVVRISSVRGAVLAGVRVTDGVLPGTVVLRHGAWFDPQTAGGEPVDANGSANVLTPDDPASALSCGNISSTALVRVERWTGELPAVRAFRPPEPR